MTGVDLQAAVVAVAAHGLAGAGVDMPTGPLSDFSWAYLLTEVRGHGLEGHLLDMIVRGDLRVTAEQREQAQRAHTDAMAVAALLERELMRSVDLLTEAGIDYRVSKDSPLAHLAYPNPVLRSVADLDLLVPSADLDRAIGVLAANGAAQTQPRGCGSAPKAKHRYGFDHHWEAVTFTLPSGAQLDLYRTLAPGPLGMKVDSAALFETMTIFEVGDRTLRALGMEELLLHSCYSVVLTDVPPRLVALRDVTELCLGGSIDPARVENMAARWSALSVLSHGIALAWDTFRLADAVPLSVRACRYVPTRREQWLLGWYGWPLARRLPAKLAPLRGTSGSSGKLANALGALRHLRARSPASDRSTATLRRRPSGNGES